jgi:hypothetical protein
MTAMWRTRETHHRRCRIRAESLPVPVTLRLAGDGDARELERLAQLDSRPLPPGPHLVAVRRGRIEALVSLASGEEVANPFERTEELRALLHCHTHAAPVDRDERRARPFPARAALATR